MKSVSRERQPGHRGDEDRSAGWSEELAQRVLRRRIQAEQSRDPTLLSLGKKIDCHNG